VAGLRSTLNAPDGRLVLGAGAARSTILIVADVSGADRRGTVTMAGTSPIVNGEGEVVAIVSVPENAADSRLLEHRSRGLTEHFQLALEAGGLGTWRWDMATGATVWDSRMEALFGLPAGAFDGSFDTYVSLLHPDDRDEVLRVIDDAVNAKSSYRIEHRVQWSDGTVRWLSGAGGVILDDFGSVTGTIGCSMDVTDRVQEEVDRRKLAELAIASAARERLHHERIDVLSAINGALNTSSGIRDIMVNVTTAAVPRLGDWCVIYVIPESGALVPDIEFAHTDPAMIQYARELQQQFPYDPHAAVGVPNVIRSGMAEFYEDITDDTLANVGVSVEERRVIGELALASSITVPLIKRERTLGAIQFIMSSPSRRYTDEDVALVRIVASRVAASLENRRLNDRQRAIAITLQRSLLPASLPEIPGVEVAVRYWAAGEGSEVGGDFYDLFALDDTRRWGIVIGDVCGTGPAAAALTGLARHTMRTSAWHDDPPEQVLASLNRAIIRSGSESFCTAIYATLDQSLPTPMLTVCSGGHPLPIRVTVAGAAGVGSSGPLLGVFPSVSFQPVSFEVEPGDAIVFYTDGATDLRAPYGLTEDQFGALVERAASGSTAEQMADNLRIYLGEILPFERRNDDLAILILRVAGPQP
jgi:PAS domain S-box-containing protein